MVAEMLDVEVASAMAGQISEGFNFMDAALAAEVDVKEDWWYMAAAVNDAGWCFIATAADDEIDGKGDW